MRINHNYFPSDDLKYSLTSSKQASKRKKIEKFAYPSGSVYKGEWLGGFRDGFGSMEWPDGSSYTGNWSYGYPYGLGKFVHIDEDVYNGQ